MSIGAELERMLADWANTVSRRALDADPALRTRLEQLEGRSIELILLAPASLPVPTKKWHLNVTQGTLQLKPGPATTPNVIVTGAALDLANWLFRQDAAGVTIEGDDTTLLETLAVLRSYNPDIQSTLNQIFGETLSQRVVGSAEAGLRGVQSILQAAGAGLEQEASARFVKRDHLDSFLADIDELRLRVDRLAANIKQKENPP